MSVWLPISTPPAAASADAGHALAAEAQKIVAADPAVATVTGFTGGRGTNQAQMFVSLKPLEQRDASAFEVMARLRPKLARIPGAQLMMFPMQDLFVGGRMSFAQFQYTLEADSTAELRYLVLPERPAGTAGWTEDALAALVTRDCMIGTARPRLPQG